MNFYQEITLDSTNSLYKLWSKVYNELHKIFYDVKKNNIFLGISFPEYYFNEDKQIGFLGSKLRIFSMKEEHFFNIGLAEKLRDLKVYISNIEDVPTDIKQYVCYSRFQCKTSAERLARHRLKTKKDMDYSQAVNHYKNKLKTSNFPYVLLRSSKGYDFRLFIRKISAEKTNIFEFNTYGLSKISSVPEF